MSKKILFMTSRRKFVSTFWNAAGEAKCREYGFDVDIPAAAGDLENCDWRRLLPDYDAVITTWESPVCSRDFLSAAPRVKVIGHCAGSVVSVTDETTYEAGVAVTTANPVMAEGVAQWSLLATLLAQRRLTGYAHLRKYEQPYWPAAGNMQDIRNMTIGLWGLGDTAKLLLEMLAPLHPGRILICSRHAAAEELAKYGARRAGLEDLLRESDVFHCLVGVNQESYQRLGAAEFAMMKTGATFVNCGRARLIREEELVAELQRGRINAILDVYYREPLEADSKLIALDNVILTPHNAGFPGRDRYLPFVLDEFDRFFRGKEMLSAISRDRFLTMTNERLGR